MQKTKKELLNTVNGLSEWLHWYDYALVVNYGYLHIKSLKEIYRSLTIIIMKYRVSTTHKNEEIN